MDNPAKFLVASNHLIRRPVLVVLAVLGLFGPAAVGAAATQAGKPAGPNFLFLFTDDQTFRSIGSVNNPQVRTPNIDRLARRGMVLTHAFNMGSWHGAVCVPSRAMLNTGRYLFSVDGSCRYNKQPLPMWGQWLSKHGYDSYVTGKWHNGAEAARRGFKIVGPLGPGMFGSYDPNAKINRAKGLNNDPYNRPAPGNTWSPYDKTLAGHWRNVDGRIVHSSKLWADVAIDWLTHDIKQSDRPFLLYVAFNAPHDPRQSPREYVEMYPPQKLDLPPNFLPLPPFDPMGGYRKMRDERLAPFPRTAEAVKVHLQEYYAIITHADYHIGRILDALEQSGKADNTYIIFTADHGLAVGQHGLMGKQNLYDHSIRVPFIVAGPGIRPGSRCDAMFYMQCLFATTCELAGIDPPDTVQYRSIVPLLKGRADKLYDSIFGAYAKWARMVRTERYKLIRYPQIDKVQLFDLANDPWEMKNLADQPDQAERIEQLDRLLARWQKELGDPLAAGQAKK